MKRLFTLLLLVFAVAFGISAKYLVYNVKGSVKVLQRGITMDAKKGMELLATDNLVIDRGASIEILNNETKKIFTSTQHGRFSVTRVIIDAQKQADDNMKSIRDKINVGTAPRRSATNYASSGHVMRTVETYCRPEPLDPADMAAVIIANIKGEYPAANCPLPVTHSSNDHNGLRYEVLNELTDTIYFNTIKIKRAGTDMFDISELSQPGSCYIVAPSQSLAREQAWGIDPGEETMIILSYYPFEVDNLISLIKEQMTLPRPLPAVTAPSVYVKLLND